MNLPIPAGRELHLLDPPGDDRGVGACFEGLAVAGELGVAVLELATRDQLECLFGLKVPTTCREDILHRPGLAGGGRREARARRGGGIRAHR